MWLERQAPASPIHACVFARIHESRNHSIAVRQ
jgi:hypothetical protein